MRISQILIHTTAMKAAAVYGLTRPLLVTFLEEVEFGYDVSSDDCENEVSAQCFG